MSNKIKMEIEIDYEYLPATIEVVKGANGSSYIRRITTGEVGDMNIYTRHDNKTP